MGASTPASGGVEYEAEAVDSGRLRGHPSGHLARASNEEGDTMTAATCARPSFVPVLAAASVTIPR
jgi:hypothetical protein